MYYVLVMDSTGGKSGSEDRSPNALAVAIPVVVSILLLIVVAAVGIVYYRRRLVLFQHHSSTTPLLV